MSRSARRAATPYSRGVPDSNDAPAPPFRTDRDGAVLTVTLDDGAHRNPQNPALWAAFARLVDELPDDVRVVVLRADGPSFSGGLDRRLFGRATSEAGTGLLALADDGPGPLEESIRALQEDFGCWRRANAVVIAAVQGHAIGAGFQLALAADVRIVADDVSFAMAETSLGLVPDLGGVWQLERLVGPARAFEMCVSGRRVGADEAVATGIAVQAVPAAELDSAAQDLADQVLQAPGCAVRELTSLVRGAGERDFQAHSLAERQAQTRLISRLAEKPGN